MPSIAEGPEFVGLFKFVLTLGALRGPFIEDLKAFVGFRGQGRHVRSTLVAACSSLSESLPHLNVACIIAAYTAPAAFFKDGYSFFVSPGDIKSLIDGNDKCPTSVALKAETLLAVFHREFARGGVYASLSNTQRVDFLAALDSTVARFCLGKNLGARHQRCPTIEHVAQLFVDELVGMGVTVPIESRLSAVDMMPAPEDDPSPPAAKKMKPTLQPRIIQYDRYGKAITHQDVYTKTETMEECHWHCNQPLNQGIQIELLRAACALSINCIHDALHARAEGTVTITRHSKDGIRVVAARDMQAGEMRFAPYIGGLGNVMVRKKESKPSPNCIIVEAQPSLAFIITPTVKWPPRGVTVQEFKKAVLPPFWVIERLPEPSEPANCRFIDVDVTNVHSVELKDDDVVKSSSISYFTVPILVNSRAVVKGERLFIEVAPKAKKAAASSSSRPMNWERMTDTKALCSKKPGSA